jgi:hypothetical protein
MSGACFLWVFGDVVMSKGRGRGANALWSVHASAKEVWHLLKVGIEVPLHPHDALEQDLRTMAAPHMAVLVHKRTKLAKDGDSVLRGAWLAELSAFAERVGRYLATELGEDRRRVIGLLDDIVAHEQDKLANGAGELIPVTSRFDMRWAH